MQAESLNSQTVAVFYIETGLRPGAPGRLNRLGKFSVGKDVLLFMEITVKLVLGG